VRVKFNTSGATAYKPVLSLPFVMSQKFCSILKSLPIIDLEGNILINPFFDAL
jgi:hypothetical protein